MLKFITFFILMLLSFVSNSSEYYRADSRSPDEIQITNGFYPRGQDEYFDRGTQMNINLFSHAQGTQTGFVRYDDGYVSTSSSLRSAHLIGQTILSGQSVYYIYVVASAPNLIDVNSVLGQYSPHPSEFEFAALGGIPWNQIIGWYTVSYGVISERMTRNRSYRNDLYSTLNVTPPEDSYQFAGFPSDHAAWRQEPWINFSPLGCRGLTKTIENKDHCLEEQNNDAYYFLQKIRTITKQKKKIYFIETVSSIRMIFPKHDYLHKWVDLDGRGNLSYCGFNTDANNDKKHITCLRNFGNFHFKTSTVFLNDYGWANGQDFTDANGDGKTDYCRLQYNWTHPVCSLSTLNKPFSENKEGPYINGGYDNTRNWTEDKTSLFCRQTSGTENICSDLIGKISTTFTDSDFGWTDSRMWIDIDNNGKSDYCRLVYNYTHLRCNLNKGDSWKSIETGYVDGGYSDLRFKVKMTYEHLNYCRVINNYNQMQCTEVKADNSIDDYIIALPFQIKSKSGIEFNDIDGDGFDDLCKYDVSNNKVQCYLNENKKFSSEPISLPLTGSPLVNLGGFSTKIIGARQSSNTKSAICYNVGYGSMRCDVYEIY